MFQFRTIAIILLAALLAGACLAQTTGTVRGVLTDDSGAVVPAATITLSSGTASKTAQTQADGTYTFTGVAPGEYHVKTSFPGFAPVDKVVTVTAGAVTVPIQLSVSASKQEITVKDTSTTSVSVEPDNNSNALVLKGEDLAALPDDPDDLSDALQALAGPGAGPNGGSIYIDGFSGGQLPPKDSIREIRINQNPFSAEYDKLGFGRIEILTRPGTDHLRGTLFFNDSDGVFNSRNPYSTNKPDFSSRMFGGNLGGPLSKKASFFVDFNRRQVTDNALINAVYLDPSTFSQTPIQTAVVTPNTRTEIGPRVDYALSRNNTLVARFEYGWNSRENQGIGGYSLPSPYANTAYNSTGNNQNLMLTETSVLSTSTVNETRFQFARNSSESIGNLLPQVVVSGAFTAGGANEGNNYTTSKHYELQNNTSIQHGTHTFRFGVRARRESSVNMSPSGFGGTFYFNGLVAPVLDPSFNVVMDASGNPETAPITAIQQYARTVELQQAGYSAATIRQLGGGASQFTIDAGNPYASIYQYDVGAFAQDDWRLRPNLTLSYGLRYEVQTNLSDHGDWAPRLGFAWAPGSAKTGRQKTVIRGGFGVFYERVGENLIEQANLLNGVNQLSYTVTDPNTFPNIPSLASMSPAQNAIYQLDANLRPLFEMQGAIGVERQLPRNTTVAVTYTYTRALHEMQTVPINTPLPGSYIFGQPGTGVYPYGASAGDLFLYESGGLLKQNILMANFNTRFTRNISLFGNYQYNDSHDLPGTPTDPYNFGADWGRSPLQRTHRFQLVGSILMPGNVRLNPFVTLQTGAPYDVTLGQDIYGNTLRNARPVFAGSGCADVKDTPLGNFCMTPDPGVVDGLVPRDYLTAAGLVSINFRIGRTFGFGARRGSNSGMPPGGFGGGGGGPHGGGPGGGGMRMGGGPGRGMFGGDSTEHRYNLTISLMVNNILNHDNPANYVGSLNSPLFGLPTGVNTGFGGGPMGRGGTAANNRRIEFQMRFSF